MKQYYSIGIMALEGGVIGYAIFRSTGWLGSGIGIIIGILVGALIADRMSHKVKSAYVFKA